MTIINNHIPPYWQDAKKHLAKVDSVLEDIINGYPNEVLKSRGEPFVTLLRAIAGQQISVKAADAVWERFSNAASGVISPDSEIFSNPDKMRECGLSRQKIVYMQNIVQFFNERPDVVKSWNDMLDEEIIRDLTTIKGVGRWTAEMFLIFCLLRSDILPMGDIGLIKAINLKYATLGNEAISKDDIMKISDKWRPYRTVATWYLWRSLDPVVVEY